MFSKGNMFRLRLKLETLVRLKMPHNKIIRSNRSITLQKSSIFGYESEATKVIRRGSEVDDTGLFLLIIVWLSTYNSYYEYHSSTGFFWRLEKLVVKFDRQALNYFYLLGCFLHTTVACLNQEKRSSTKDQRVHFFPCWKNNKKINLEKRGIIFGNPRLGSPSQITT